ncbi:hypothetical protein [Halobacterium sp. CBA1126]|uniref:hypothetical protein n=1 Tax=Halobacterium TaxID=2239 RepID=UPI0012FC4947|nr:hypothetical protein [Halobacterium sp. CBA1126]MUV60792.1 hypothetical protein [Halobacterium sp. CBA1126]
MDRVRLAYDAVRAYVYALLLAGAVTVVWLLAPEVAETPQVSGLWFALAGFGVLVLVTFLLAQYTRRV